MLFPQCLTRFPTLPDRNCAQLFIFVCETVPNSMSSPPVPKLCLTLHSALYLTVPNAIQDSRYAQSKILPGNSPWSLAKRHLNEPRLRSMRGHIVKRETCRSSRRRRQPRNVVCFHNCSYVFWKLSCVSEFSEKSKNPKRILGNCVKNKTVHKHYVFS